MAKPAIIFISDIHYCEDKEESLLQKGDGNDYYQKWETYVERVAKTKDITPKYLVISGDLVEAAKRVEYDEILLFLDKFCKRFKISRNNVLIIPGNHDINWNGVANYCDKNKIPESKASELYDVKLENYCEFFDRFKGGKLDPSKAILDSIFIKEEGLTILGLNSLVQESHRKSDHVGAVDVEKLKEEIEDYIKPDQKIFVVTHHSVANTHEKELPSTMYSDVLKEALGIRGINTFIYGHHHVSESKVQIIGDKEDRVRLLEIGSLAKHLPDINGIKYNNRFTIGICEKDKLVLSDHNNSAGEWEERNNHQYVHELYIDDATKNKGENKDKKDGSGSEELLGGGELPEADVNNAAEKKIIETATTLPVINVVMHDKSDFLYDHLKKDGNYKEGHFHWKDNKKTRGWINVTSFIGNIEILSRIKGSIMTMYLEYMKGVKTVIGYGIEGNVIGSSLVDFWLKNDVNYYFYPSVHKEDEHIDFEKSLWDADDNRDVLLLFDFLPSDKYLDEILNSNSKLKACKNIYVLALFCNTNLLNGEEASLKKEIKRYALAKVDVEVCDKKDEECMVCRNQLAKVYLL